MNIQWLADFFDFKAAFHGYLLPEVLFFGIVGVLALSTSLSFIRAFGELSRKKNRTTAILASVKTVQKICASCGWEGEIPILRMTCPKCGDNNFADPED